MKHKIVHWLNKNINNIFTSFFIFWFLISAYFLLPIAKILRLSKDLGILSYIIIHYILLLLFFAFTFFTKKISINRKVLIILILNTIFTILFTKVKAVNVSETIDSMLRLVAAFASVAFILHAIRIKRTLKMLDNRQEINQMLIYPFDVRKKVARGTYRYITSDKDFWIKSQDGVSDIQLLGSLFILMCVFFVPDETLHVSTFFLPIMAYIRIHKNKWVFVDKDGNVI